MSNIAIKVEKISKLYRIGLAEEKSDTLVGDIASWIRSPISNYRKLRKLTRFSDTGSPYPPTLTNNKKQGTKKQVPITGIQEDDTIWALKNVSFEVKRGEVIGIIGPNGAGKTTLLKIISRITEPTSGRVIINGRVSSLLEVGTGFHPELTGRENIYLNGTILGMSKSEVDRKFDEILEFSGVEKFVDTPVKRFSSGMHVRLAFAVAAHLDPEILMIDEVLAVGDAQFQKKCLGKMGNVARGGRTVIFVSHNMTAVQSLCRSAMMLDQGRLVTLGPVSTVISRYLKGMQSQDQQGEWTDPRTAPGDDVVRIRQVRVTSDNGNGLLTMQSPLRIETVYWVLRSGITTHITYHLINEQGIVVLTSGCPSAIREPGSYKAVCSLPANLLNTGGYFLKLLVVQDENRVTYVNDSIASFTIEDTAERNHGWMGREPGVVQPVFAWQTLRIADIVE